MPHTPSEIARAYHVTTKHQMQRYARSLGYMDWDSQPDPFRRFAGAAEVPLSGLEPVGLGRVLELALGLTAWKQYEGNRWALRANPSSGNLHPTEGYAITRLGVLHFAPRERLVELRCSLDRAHGQRMAELLPPGGCLVALTSIHWREAWKYGERALRYCALDVGHAMGALDYAADCAGLEMRAVNGWNDIDLAGLLGLDRSTDLEGSNPWEREHGELLMALAPAGAGEDCEVDVAGVLEVLEGGTWHGKASRLSEEYHEWDVIHATAEAVRRVDRGRPAEQRGEIWPGRLSLGARELERVIGARRSAQSMNGQRSMGLADFVGLLDGTLARGNCAPWRAWDAKPLVHLVLFIHRVEGLDPGLYVLERDSNVHGELVGAFAPSMEWIRPEALDGIADAQHLRLFRLRRGRTESVARTISCQQDIAADGVFSLGMLARFGEVVDADASAYRRLFWECGLVGQALYIDAEAAGFNSTGIGCFFDDMGHDLLGLESSRGAHRDEWQMLYHFTVGEALHDERLETLPPYDHLD